MHYWQSAEHEIDFVLDHETFLEVKGGKATALDFAWFGRTFPRARLRVVGQDRFESRTVSGTTMQEFLLEVP